MAGGTCMMNPAVMEHFCDYIVIGDGEDVMVEIAGANDTKSRKN